MKPLFLSCQKVQKFKMPSPRSIARAALGTESELNRFLQHFSYHLLSVSTPHSLYEP